ncbi:MAG: radical SAM protein [Cyclobacteriaceae bacterium]
MPLEIQSKTILNKTKRRDPWFLDDYTVNPYSGCSFNCLFCYIRGSKYGEHMEQKLAVKTNAVDLLDKQLGIKAKKNQYGIIVLSSATDPYLQFEGDYGLTRQLLEIVLKYRFPVHVMTRSDLVLRDLDLLRQIKDVAILPEDLRGLNQKSFITFSFSSVDDDVSKIFEPGATLPGKRLVAMKECAKAGFLTGASLMPLLPGISDGEEHIREAITTLKDNGAKYAFPASLSLFGDGPSDSKTLMFRAIERHYPDLMDLYIGVFRGFRPDPAYSNKVRNRAVRVCKELGMAVSILEV